MLIDKNELIDIIRGSEELLSYQKEEVIECVNACTMYEQNKTTNDDSINKWIPCSELLPTKTKGYLVTKHIAWTRNTKESYSVCTELFYTTDNKWDCERDEDCEWKVISWMELPSSYKKGVVYDY